MNQPEYLPDFVAETADTLLMVETKASTSLNDAEVQAKAQAGATWCRHATTHARDTGGKPWKYLLVPHEQVTEDKALADFLRFERQA